MEGSSRAMLATARPFCKFLDLVHISEMAEAPLVQFVTLFVANLFV